jgi:protein-disulfide isomerase
MTRTRWIVFVAICALVLGGLVFMSKKDSVDVGNTDATKVVEQTETAIGDHVYGKKDAKVMLVEYGDFQCPACGGAYPQLKSIKEKYKGDIAFVFRNFPLTGIHPNALAAAAVAEAAGLQGKFWEMHDKLYDTQDSWSNVAADQRDSIFESYASELGLDMDKFRADRTSKKVNEKISRDQALGRKMKVDATPGIFIGDKRVGEDTVNNLVQSDGSKLSSELDAAIKDAN